MATITRSLNRWDIKVDTKKGEVLVEQRWKYAWLLKSGASNWTYDEKRKFHKTLDELIWSSWSNRVKLRVRGTDAFCRKFAGRDIPLNVDVRWVSSTQSNQHWDVSVWKNAPADPVQTDNEVDFHHGTIKLFTNSAFLPRQATNGLGVKRQGFTSAKHEFGHTLGYAVYPTKRNSYCSDEYHRNPQCGILCHDTNSIMNIGSEVRARHFHFIIPELNKMIPNCTFEIDTIDGAAPSMSAPKRKRLMRYIFK